MQEIRHLVFDERELQHLTLSYLEAQGHKPDLPAGGEWTLADTGRGPRLTVSGFGPLAAARPDVVIGSTDLLSAAILFCKRKHVPLPMRGQKHVALVRGLLALVVAI